MNDREQALMALRAGDEVVVFRHPDRTISRVEKRTPSGRLTVAGQEYRPPAFRNRHGNWHSESLHPVTDEVRQQIERASLIAGVRIALYRLGKTNIDLWPDDRLLALRAALKTALEVPDAPT